MRVRYRDYARAMGFGAHEVIELSDDDDVEVTFDAREERLADQQERLRHLEQERQMDRSDEEEEDSESDSDDEDSAEVEARSGGDGM